MGGKLNTHSAALFKDNFNRFIVLEPQFHCLQNHLNEVPCEMNNLGASSDISLRGPFFWKKNHLTTQISSPI